MISEPFDPDPYEDWEAKLDPRWHEQWVKPKWKANHKAKKSKSQIVAEATDSRDLAESVTMTYPAARFEEWWLLDSLRPLYEQNLLRDVVARVKGGKEANVYRCVGDAAAGHALVAAKVYRPRSQRNLRNDKMYRDGRAVLTEEGRIVKKNDDRTMRALGKKTAFGQQVQHTSWLMHEFTTLQRLWGAGAAVPEPIGAVENAILMGYCGDERRAAPTLHETRLGHDEAEPLFAEVMRNVELMLQHGLVHGDLSAFNILVWQGTITLIDFPQVTHIATNRDAEFIFRRDVQRVCDYFLQQGVRRDADAIAATLWAQYNTRLPDVPIIVEA